jgi:hypothetical protein
MSRERRILSRLPSRSCAKRRFRSWCADTCPMAGTRTGLARNCSEPRNFTIFLPNAMHDSLRLSNTLISTTRSVASRSCHTIPSNNFLLASGRSHELCKAVKMQRPPLSFLSLRLFLTTQGHAFFLKKNRQRDRFRITLRFLGCLVHKQCLLESLTRVIRLS